MVHSATVELLEALLTQRVNVEEFGRQLSDVLFELRQTSTQTSEKTALSRIQLYLHEFDEGHRDIHEVYMAALAAMDLARPTSEPMHSRTDIVAKPLQPGEVVPTTSSPQPDLSELPHPIAI